VLAAYAVNAEWRVGSIDLASGQMTQVPGSPVGTISQLVTGNGRALLLAGQPARSSAIMSFDVATGRWDVLKTAMQSDLDPAYVSQAEPIHFPTSGGETAHAFYYPPRNPHHVPQPGETPPLLVLAHGGPTGSASMTLNPAVQFWTTRGFAVLDVNYRGSTGYGRAYRDRLKGNWGIFDVDDCVHGARYIAETGRADPNRLAIRGGSAGGYTTLAALTFRDAFRAGASYYGVSDLESLMADTHKFEARYLDSMIGPFPERRDLYRERSPVNFPDRLRCPVIFFQGLLDKVVPPNQAEMMVEALRRKGIPVEYHAFEGEQHGFRKAETIERALAAELAFYGRVFGFSPVAPS
jgi:dipeptidyl aminopeptidase/acylaminoacyl peptidase